MTAVPSPASEGIELAQVLPEVPPGITRAVGLGRRRRATQSLSELLAEYHDREIAGFFTQTSAALENVLSQGFPRWVLTFSGGKDSTLTAILALDFLRTKPNPPKVSIVYSDTLLEIPAMRDAAEKMLRHFERMAVAGTLPISVHRVEPPLSERFWVCMLGRGYPPPKPRFRWCTRRLKITPADEVVSTGERTAVLTGVRYGESAQRTGRLVASCANGGECGQDFWWKKGEEGSDVTYFAPIIHWRTCRVWDFLHLVAPGAGWPTNNVYALYGDSDLRFGCWTCTLVRRDRTVEELIRRNPDSPLRTLRDFREYLYLESQRKSNRWRSHGHLGPLTLDFRKEALRRLLGIQRASGLTLVSVEEVREIRRLWRGPYGVPPARRRKGKVTRP